MQKLKLALTGISISIVLAGFGQGAEFLLKSKTASIDNIYLAYMGIAFIFLLGFLIAVIKGKFNPHNNVLPILSIIVAITTVTFLILYEPFFNCLKSGNTWHPTQACITPQPK